MLDVEDPIDKAYHLEVSSPGIDRPLVRKSDFEAALGHLIKMETAVMVAERKRFRGKIASTDGEAVTIERDQASYGDEPVVTVPWDAIAEARLILTDDLIDEALKKDKQARQQAKKKSCNERCRGGGCACKATNRGDAASLAAERTQRRPLPEAALSQPWE